MSEHSDKVQAKHEARVATASAITALATAGMCLLEARDAYPPQGQALATAVREDIKNLIRDVEALQAVIAQA